ncbi:hypothetical protein [Streptomyces sp. NPDC047525]
MSSMMEKAGLSVPVETFMNERFATEGSAITREAFCTDWSSNDGSSNS